MPHSPATAVRRLNDIVVKYRLSGRGPPSVAPAKSIQAASFMYARMYS